LAPVLGVGRDGDCLQTDHPGGSADELLNRVQRLLDLMGQKTWPPKVDLEGTPRVQTGCPANEILQKTTSLWLLVRHRYHWLASIERR
jgi:hypothetical protein